MDRDLAGGSGGEDVIGIADDRVVGIIGRSGISQLGACIDFFICLRDAMGAEPCGELRRVIAGQFHPIFGILKIDGLPGLLIGNGAFGGEHFFH